MKDSTSAWDIIQALRALQSIDDEVSGVAEERDRLRERLEQLKELLERGRKAGIESRGISDHGFIDSIYFRDPNGYVIELTAKRPGHEEDVGDEGDPREILEKWTQDKAARQ